MNCQRINDSLLYREGTQQLLVEPWGENALRVRMTRAMNFTDENWALLRPSCTCAPEIRIAGERAQIRNGRLTAILNANGWLSFENDGRVILREYWRERSDVRRFCAPLYLRGRELKPNPGHADWRLTVRFESNDTERIYGMGQYQDGRMNKKGCMLELAQRNTQSTVPFYVSSEGYGFLWNNPAVGRVTFAANLTQWEAECTQEMDYWICAGTYPSDILRHYASVTGLPPMMPEYGLGYWQSKMRYRTQEELLETARRHKKLGLPLDVIVADFFHWPYQGDFRFDERDWPDVDGMVRELKEMGIELMVSIWPTVDERSENYTEMLENGLLVQNDRGINRQMDWNMGNVSFFDATEPRARCYVWQKAFDHYYRHGIRIFWLDEAEPEIKQNFDFDIYRYARGPAMQVSNLYPWCFAQTFYEGMRAQGQEEIVNLVRCAWAGSQRYGALVWSGDVHSSFRSMRDQLAAGLSMSMAGIPWWDCDLGGFLGGDNESELFRELLARWFAWGAFMPVMRMHGNRLPMLPPEQEFRDGVRQLGTGNDNEVWSFGEETQRILERFILIREKLRPYTRQLMREAHESGAPLMRPLFYEFPLDQRAWEIETAYMYGPQLLVAPVLEPGVRVRSVYLPSGAMWTEDVTGRCYEGGQTVEAQAPINVIPVFRRDASVIRIYEE